MQLKMTNLNQSLIAQGLIYIFYIKFSGQNTVLEHLGRYNFQALEGPG